MVYEWDPKKAKANLRKHRVSFEEGATVFFDSFAVTYPDPDHSDEELREITIGYSDRRRVISSRIPGEGNELESSAHEKRQLGNATNMKKASNKKTGDLRPEYDLSQLKGGVRGKYYREATAGTNLVLIEPELASVFPDTESVNRALRLLADTAQSAASNNHPRRRAAKRRLKRSA